MEIVVNVVAADEDDLLAVAESVCPLNDWSGFVAPGLDTVKVATLHSLLTGDSLQASLALYEPVFVNDGETGALRLADELMEVLTELDEEALEQAAEELAATEDFENEAWDVEAIHSLLTDLCELALLAESQGQVVMVWIYLRPD